MKLVVEESFGERDREPIELEVGKKLSIGRDESCDLKLESPYVSRRQAELSWNGKRPFLKAFACLNGIYVNDRLLRENEERELRPNDEINMPSGFRLRLTGRSLSSGRPDYYLDLARQYSNLKSELHGQLLERADFRSSTRKGLSPEKRRIQLRETLNNLFASSRLSLSEELEDFIVVEAFQRGLLDWLILQKKAQKGLDSTFEESWHSDPNKEFFDNEVESWVEKLNLGDSDRSVREQAESVPNAIWDIYRQRREHLNQRFLDYVVKQHLRRDLEDLVFGYGPLEDLLTQPGINEVMVVGKDHIFAETSLGLEETGRSFPEDSALEVVIRRIVSPVGREVNTSEPIVDARLKDGSRVHIVVPPVAFKGASITIRRFPEDPFTPTDLISDKYKTLNKPALDFLRACIKGRKNIIISGGTGSGKTTLLNVFGSCIPDDQRLVVIEDSAELQLRQPNLVNLETRTANAEGKGEITVGNLVRAALRMRPDRIIVGECRGEEALDMLQAMNTGHSGSMTTAHANSPSEMISRLEVMVLQANSELPVQAIHRQIAGALDLIVQIQRQQRHKRVTHISQIVGYDTEDARLIIEDIFRLVERPDGDHELCFTGFLPTFIEGLIEKGDVKLEEIFGDGSSGAQP